MSAILTSSKFFDFLYRSLKGPPQGTWSPKVESFYLSPIKVNTSRKPSKVSSELIEELSSIHDIENAILFNDMNRLFLCRSKDYLFTKYHFQVSIFLLLLSYHRKLNFIDRIITINKLFILLFLAMILKL